MRDPNPSWSASLEAFRTLFSEEEACPGFATGAQFLLQARKISLLDRGTVNPASKARRSSTLLSKVFTYYLHNLI
jgi:hypothetical protein